MVRVPGSWKSLSDLEENVTLPELELMLTAAREIEQQARKFQAAIQGINLDDAGGSSKTRFEELQQKALAEAHGVSEDQLVLSELGFRMNDESDDE